MTKHTADLKAEYNREGNEIAVRNGTGELTSLGFDMYYREFKTTPDVRSTPEQLKMSRWFWVNGAFRSYLSRRFNVQRTKLKEWVQNILLQADIRIGGRRPWDITVHNDRFYARVLRLGSLGRNRCQAESFQVEERPCDKRNPTSLPARWLQKLQGIL